MGKIQTGVWPKESKNGNKYYYGYDKESNTKVVIFNNTKDGENQPSMNVIVEDWDQEYQKKEKQEEKNQEENIDDLPF